MPKILSRKKTAVCLILLKFKEAQKLRQIQIQKRLKCRKKSIRIFFLMIRNGKGFTLIELMVVVLILGILVAIAIPVFNNTTMTARLKSCYANLRTIDGAITHYQGEHNSDPASVTALVNAGFLRADPTCPHTSVQDYGINGGTDRATCSQGHIIP